MFLGFIGFVPVPSKNSPERLAGDAAAQELTGMPRRMFGWELPGLQKTPWPKKHFGIPLTLSCRRQQRIRTSGVGGLPGAGCGGP